jgi:hypothetical protein
MKYFYLFILYLIAFNKLTSQTCNNTPETSTGVTVLPSFTPTSTTSVLGVQFTSNGTLPAIPGIPAIWLKVPGGATNPQIPSVVSGAGIDLGFAAGVQGADLGLNASDYYYFFTTNTPNTLSTKFPSGVDVLIGTITFSTPVPGVEIFNMAAFPPVDPGSGYIYYETALQGCMNYEDNFIATEANIPLPIKLKRFTAERDGDFRASNLEWTSTLEVNASHFDVERSADGFEFSSIGLVKAAGNSNIEQHYSLVDRDIPTTRNKQDVYYYRLKMVDLDGSFEYSDVRSVRFDNDNTIELTYYPNPTSGILQVKMSTPDSDKSESTEAIIYDLSGRITHKQVVSTKGITEIDMSNFTNGSYNIIINHGGKTYNNKVVKTN